MSTYNKRLNTFATQEDYEAYLASIYRHTPHVALISNTKAIIYVDEEAFEITVGTDGKLQVNRAASLDSNGKLSFDNGTSLDSNGNLTIN